MASGFGLSHFLDLKSIPWRTVFRYALHAVLKEVLLMRSPKPAYRYRELLIQYPLFRKLFAARAVSLLGDWLNLLALLALLRDLELASPNVLSALFILKLLPNFLMSPLAGILADRFSRQKLMIISDLARFAFVMCFFLAPIFPKHAYIIILTMTGLQAASAAFFEPAKTAMLPDLVPGEALSAANGLNALTWSVTYALGSALGGVITYLWGWRFALLLDAGSYLLSAWLIATMILKKRERRTREWSWMNALGITDLVQGFAYIRGQTEVAYTMCLKSGWCLAGAIPLILTLYGEQKYHFGGRPDIGTAFLFACRAIGTGIGPIIGQRFFGQDRPGLNRAIWIAFGLGAAFYFAFGAVDDPLLAGLAVLIAHIGGSIVWVYSTVRLQLLVPDEFRGRVFAAELGLATLFISVSTWGIGYLADNLSWSLPHLVFLAASFLAFSCVVSWLIGGVALGLGRKIDPADRLAEEANG